MVATWNRWHKLGHDRLYVNDVNGAPLGYLDLAAGEAEHVDLPNRLEEFRATVAAWIAAGRPNHPGGRPQRTIGHLNAAQDPVPPRTVPAPEPPWLDLAENKPGEGVAQLAAAHRRGRPVTSRLEPILGVHSDAQAWAKGAAGERTTAKALRALTHPSRPLFGRSTAVRWKILHSLPLGDYGADLDHLLIGPTGVFAINTKNHPGKTIWVGPRGIKIDHYDTDYAGKAKHEAQRADTLLTATHPLPPSVSIWPVLSIVGAVAVTGRPATTNGVLVSAVDKLARDLSGYPAILTDDQIAAIYDAARRSTTWTTMTPRTAQGRA